jgi:AcrR family transcriptional regulator
VYAARVTPGTAPEKTLRSDARRNRERLVASARELFARDGIDVPVEEITSHAGVGMGTLYRHFATKDELIDAVLEDEFAQLVATAERALEEDDAWLGLTRFFEQALELHAANRGLKGALTARAQAHRRAEAMRKRIKPLLHRLVERAHEQGSLRPDFAPADLPLVFWTTLTVIERTAAVVPEYWRRHLGLLLDGLRAEGATPLPVPPLTDAQLSRTARKEA